MSPSLIKRRKTHFHNLPCGATVILGNNGYVWICPTEGEVSEQTGGYEQNFEVCSGHAVFGRCAILFNTSAKRQKCKKKEA